MPEQLNIMGLWERTAPGEAEPELPPPPLPPPPPVDPRQEELLAGAHTLRATLEDACVALDPAALRAAHAELLARFGTQRWAEQAPAWAEGLAWLVEGSADESAARALLLRGEDVVVERFPGASAALLGLVRTAALRRAARELIAERGVAAALRDGRPAGFLPLIGGDFVLARELLTAAGGANPQWLAYLGEAAWGLGDAFAALQAYCAASLVDPGRIDLEAVTCTPVLELLDVSDELELGELPFAFLPVLADLLGKHALDDGALDAPEGASAPRKLAELLRRYRRDRPAESARIEAKRAMARLAPPGLRELLRRL